MIGVLDTGVDADHVEFDGKRINYRYVSLFPHHPQFGSRDIRGFDLDGHGTHVCGIMCGQNIGIAPEAELFVASVIESETTLTSLIRVSAGLNWLLAQFSKPERQYRPAILNISLGFPSSSPGINPTDYQNRLNLMERLIRTLRKFNVLPVCAIGNDGPGNFGYPGAFDRVLGIGAVDFENKVASFSGGGIVGNSLVKPNLVGYGVGIYSSVERDYDGNSIYQRFNGTSMASPYVAGVGALYRCKYPGLNVDRIEELLIGNALVLSGQNNIGNGLAVFKQ